MLALWHHGDYCAENDGSMLAEDVVYTVMATYVQQIA
jgi:hypothetical protein